MTRLPLILLLVLASCSTIGPAKVSLLPPQVVLPPKLKARVLGQQDGQQSYQASQPWQLYLTWSNRETWVVNIVEYRTNLNQPWQFYGYVTNGYTNFVKLRLDATNTVCYFRPGFVCIW